MLNNNLDYSNALKWGTQQLIQGGLEEPALDARILLEHCLSLKPMMGRLLNPVLTFKKNKEYQGLIHKRKYNWPIAYLTGSKQVFHSTYRINYKVFIPRPETELLILKAKHLIDMSKTQPGTLIDIGCGSGIIACELAKVYPKKRIIAFDISKIACDTTKQNAKHFKLNNVEVIHQNAFSSSILKSILSRPGAFIVSNPPYICKNEIEFMDKDVLKFEPKRALFATREGFGIIHKLIQLNSLYHCPVLIEIGFLQAPYLANYYPNRLHFFNDDANIQRFCYCSI